jgi:hypothetical protein
VRLDANWTVVSPPLSLITLTLSPKSACNIPTFSFLTLNPPRTKLRRISSACRAAGVAFRSASSPTTALALLSRLEYSVLKADRVCKHLAGKTRLNSKLNLTATAGWDRLVSKRKTGPPIGNLFTIIIISLPGNNRASDRSSIFLSTACCPNFTQSFQ